MSTVFLKILNMALNASWLILAVMAARLLLKKAPKWITCLMWALVAFRLVCPVSLKSVVSLLPSGEVIPESIVMDQNPHIYSGIRVIDNTVNPVVSGALAPDPSSSANPMQVVVFAAGIKAQSSIQHESDAVYDLYGRLVRRSTSGKLQNEKDQLKRGIYIIDGHKTIIR